MSKISLHIEADNASAYHDILAALTHRAASGSAFAEPGPETRKSAEPSSASGSDDPLVDMLSDTIKAIKAELPNLATAELTRLAQAESAGKNRATLLKAIEEEIEGRDKAPVKPTAEPDPGPAKAEPKSDEEVPTLEQMREATLAFKNAGADTETIRDIIKSAGGAKLSEIPENKRAYYLETVEARTKEFEEAGGDEEENDDLGL